MNQIIEGRRVYRHSVDKIQVYSIGTRPAQKPRYYKSMTFAYRAPAPGADANMNVRSVLFFYATNMQDYICTSPVSPQ